MRRYAPFLMLPSIRCLRACHFHGSSFSWPTDFPLHSSTVTAIELCDSAIAATALDNLLSGIKALKTFTYAHRQLSITSTPYQPAAIVDSLRRYASHSLEVLDIQSIALKDRIINDEEPESAIGSLRMFTRLKDIRPETRVFLHPNSGNFEGTKTLSEFHVDEGRSYMSDFVIDVLPASVRALTLVPVLDGENTRILLQGLAERKVKELPKFESLIFEGYDPLGTELKDALEASGIELGFGPRQVRAWLMRLLLVVRNGLFQKIYEEAGAPI